TTIRSLAREQTPRATTTVIASRTLGADTITRTATAATTTATRTARPTTTTAKAIRLIPPPAAMSRVNRRPPMRLLVVE
ncbi:unnamed protein product, partial [Mycena citricolor]